MSIHTIWVNFPNRVIDSQLVRQKQGEKDMKAVVLAMATLGVGALATGGASSAEIKIGVVGPNSGPAAAAGIAAEEAYQYVADKINSAGGITVGGENANLTLIFEDSASRPEVGVSAAQKLLTRDSVDVLIGDTTASSVTIALMDVAASYGKFATSGQPISSEIGRKIESNPELFANFWKGNWSSNSSGQAIYDSVEGMIASGMFDPQNKTIAFIFEDSDYGKSSAENTFELFKEQGWTEAAHDAVPLGHTDFYPQLSKLRADEPDLFVSVFTSSSSGVALVKQMKEQGFASRHLAIYYPSRPEFHEGIGDSGDSEGLLWVPYAWDPVNNNEHKALFDEMATAGISATGDHAASYCIFSVLVDNIRRAGTLEPAKLSEAYATTDFKCTTGRFVYDTANHTPKVGAEYIPIPVAQIQSGVSWAVWPPVAATANFR